MFPFWIIGVFVALTGLVVSTEFHLLIGILLTGFGLALIFFHKMISPKYPVKVVIFMRRHGSMRIISDMATRLKHDDGTYYYKLKKIKDEFPAATYDNLYPSGSHEVMMMYSPAPGEYHPAKVKDQDLEILQIDKDGNEKKIKVNNIEPIPDDLQQWHVLTQRRMRQRYMQVSAWEKYYPLVVVIIMAFAIMFIIYGLFNAMDPVVKEFKRASDSFKSAATTNAEIIEKLTELLEDKQEVSGQDLPAPPDVGS